MDNILSYTTKEKLKKLNQNSVAKFIFNCNLATLKGILKNFVKTQQNVIFKNFVLYSDFKDYTLFFGPQDFSTPIFYGPFNAQKPLNSITTRLLSSDAIKRQNYWIINQLDFNLGPCTFGNLKQNKNKCKKKHNLSTEHFG